MRQKDPVAFGTKELDQEEIWLTSSERGRERHVAAGEPAAFPLIVDYYKLFADKGSLFKTVPPSDLPSQWLTDRDIEKVKAGCLRECDEASARTISVLREFVEFCELLSRPENVYMVKSGQFVSKLVNTRTEQDMVNEAAREATGLPKYTAYAKVLQDEGAKIWTGKIRTLELGPTTSGADVSETMRHVELREKIHEEIAQRHQRLLKKMSGGEGPPPATY